MITSVHVAKLGPSGLAFRGAKPSKVPGLLSSNGGPTAHLGPGLLPRPDLTRTGMVAFWESEAALDDYLTSDPVGQKLAKGWHARLEPLRAFGSWPGLPEDTSARRTVVTEGPVMVTTLAKLKMTQAYRFFKTSAKAEERVIKSPGLIWTAGFGSTPFVATLSIWESAQAAADYAYGEAQPEHTEAIGIDRAKAFHHVSAFVRYRPLSVSGSMDTGKNPIPPFSLD